MSLFKKIVAAQTSGQIVRVYRDEERVDGFVTAVGKTFFILEIFSETIHLNGFNCFRFEDVEDCEVPAPNEAFKLKVLQARKIQRTPAPNIDLASTSALLKSAAQAFPVATIHLKYDDEDDAYDEDLSDVCYIGKIMEVNSTEVTLHEILPDAEWNNERTTYPLELIDRVDFAGGYEEALLLVAPPLSD